MEFISRRRPSEGLRSGGKMVRQGASYRRTPYDRPPPPPAQPSRNPNWLTGLIFPATRKLASGAGKLISSVFTDGSSSSSDSGSGSEDNVDEDNDNDVPSDGVDGLDETALRTLKSSGKGPQVISGKIHNKHVIEQLINQETFSREESDRLIKIINSRVLDNFTLKDGLEGRPSETPSRLDGNGTADLCTKAIMEAKKWIEEKKMGSSSKPDLDNGTFNYNSFLPPHGVDGDGNSPVDIAKSYMQALPPWASPSIKHIDVRTQSPMMAVELFKEETLHSIGGYSFSSSKKRHARASGSWNLQEEIRRVRSKATEDMLRSYSSEKTDPLSYAPEPKTTPFPLMVDKPGVGKGNVTHELNFWTARNQVHASATMAVGVDALDEFRVLEKMQDGSGNEALSSDPTILKQNQNLEANQTVDGEGSASRPHQSTSTGRPTKQYTDLRSSNGDCSTAKEVTEFAGASNANGFPTSNLSLSAGLDAEQNPRQSDEGNLIEASLSRGKLTSSIPLEENCELLSEAYVEVPIVNETASHAAGSQNSSSMRQEVSPELPTADSSHGSAEKTSSPVVKKPAARKPGRYTRRVRGRSKS